MAEEYVEDTNETGTHVKLPLGYYDKETDTWYRYADIREMTGRDEERMSDPKNKRNGGKILTALLASCVTSIGPIKVVTEEMIRQLTIGDRDLLLLRIRQLSFGNSVSMTLTCPSCKARLNLDVDLNDIEVNYSTEGEEAREFNATLPRGIVVEGNRYKDAVLRLPNGVDLEFIAQDKFRQNQGLMTTAIIFRNIVKIGSKDTFTMEDIKDLTTVDREYISTQVQNHMYRPDLAVDVTCSSCGEVTKSSLDVQDFLSPPTT